MMTVRELKPTIGFPSGILPSRQLPSWIDGFFRYTEGNGSPALFRRWAAIFAVASALERRIWIRTAKGALYPNLYLIKVGPPGAGKTLATSLVHEMLMEIENHHLAPASVTKASLIDAITAAERKLVRPQENPSIITYNSLTVVSDELGVLLPAYENDFMNTLTHIYDCRVYSETRRTTKINIKMTAPQLNLIAATTPSYLNNLLPAGAWDQGFLSRTILIYSGGDGPQPLNLTETNKPGESKLQQDLIADLKGIGDDEFYGKMIFAEDAAEAIEAWHIGNGEPKPDHPKLVHYNTRRSAHLLKLCMIASASRGYDRKIILEDFVEALEWLTEAESYMPDIFKSMAVGGDQRIIEETWHFVYTIYMKEKKPILEHRLVKFVQERAPAHNVMRIIEVMKRAKIIEEQLTNVGVSYIPRGKGI